MKKRFAFVGFRHGHIYDVLEGVKTHPETELVAACEEDAATREGLSEGGKVTITHSNFDTMLAEVPCDVVAIGDYYTKRGSLAIRALQAGKHVISDKPLCTSLDELATIRELAQKNKLAVGCQLDLRDNGAMLALRKVIQDGEIGRVVTVNITAQHPLLPGSRAAWYFEPGCHGGTINDIGIHAFDLVPWLTGQPFQEIVGARSWNAKAAAHPHFEDSAQMMARLADGTGILGDFSYLAPDQCGYKDPLYWQVICHGTQGVAMTHYGAPQVRLIRDTDSEAQLIPSLPRAERRYFHDFLAVVNGQPETAALTTESVLEATEWALRTQANARP